MLWFQVGKELVVVGINIAKTNSQQLNSTGAAAPGREVNSVLNVVLLGKCIRLRHCRIATYKQTRQH
jgi:hypothetical protein